MHERRRQLRRRHGPRHMRSGERWPCSPTTPGVPARAGADTGTVWAVGAERERYTPPGQGHDPGRGHDRSDRSARKEEPGRDGSGRYEPGSESR